MRALNLDKTPNRRTSLISADRNVLEKENDVLRQCLKCHFCGGTYDHIANGNGQCQNVINDVSIRLSLEQQTIIKNNNSRIKRNISQREHRFKIRNENPEINEK